MKLRLVIILCAVYILWPLYILRIFRIYRIYEFVLRKLCGVLYFEAKICVVVVF